MPSWLKFSERKANLEKKIHVSERPKRLDSYQISSYQSQFGSKLNGLEKIRKIFPHKNRCRTDSFDDVF